MDPVFILPPEILHRFLMYVRNDVPSLLRVSKLWNQVLKSSWLWKELSQFELEFWGRNMIGAKELLKSYSLSTKMAHLASDGYELHKELLMLTTVYQDEANLINECLRASSQDHEEQGIESTINHSQYTFWSSIGSETMMVDNYLDYELHSTTSFVSQIEIKPFLARYQPGLPIYASKFVSFTLSWDKEFENPHYKSKMLKLENINVNQIFKLRPLQVGRFLRITFHEHQQQQPGDALYYTCIEHIKIRGPLVEYQTPDCKQNFTILKQILAKIVKNPISCANTIIWPRKDYNRLQALKLLRTQQLTQFFELILTLPWDSACRSQPFWVFFWQQLTQNNESPYKWFKFYIKRLYSIEKHLNRDEVLFLANHTHIDGFKRELFERGIQLNLIECTFELGNLFLHRNEFKLGLLVFEHGQIVDGMIDCYMHFDKFSIVAVLVAEFYIQPLFEQFLMQLTQKYPRYKVVKFAEAFVKRIRSNGNGTWDANFVLTTVSRILNILLE